MRTIVDRAKRFLGSSRKLGVAHHVPVVGMEQTVDPLPRLCVDLITILGGMVCVVLHAPFGGGFPVELIQAARLGPFRRPGGVCHPFAFSERKGRPCQWYG